MEVACKPRYFSIFTFDSEPSKVTSSSPGSPKTTPESISNRQKILSRELSFQPKAAPHSRESLTPRCWTRRSRLGAGVGGGGEGLQTPQGGSWLLSDDFLPRSLVLKIPGRQMAGCQVSLSLDPGSAISHLCDLGEEI